MEDLLIRKNLRCTGHLMRMSSDRLLKQVLYSQLSSGHRKRGRPRLRFKDTIKRNLKLRDIQIDSWTSLLEIINIIIVNNNISGPKIDHWGTPRFIGKVYHCTSSILTDCLQLVEYYCCELHSNGSWLSH